MPHRVFLLAAAFMLLGAGCTLGQGPQGVSNLPTAPPQETQAENRPIEEEEEKAETGNGGGVNEESKVKSQRSQPEAGPPPAEKVAKPYYIAYTPEVAAEAMAEGRPVVYYFWASWCPICRTEEPKIKSWIETSEHPIAGFRVNYDTESELKARYKVPYQHTTVFLNANGEEVERFSGPVTEAEFRAALKTAASL